MKTVNDDVSCDGSASTRYWCSSQTSRSRTSSSKRVAGASSVPTTAPIPQRKSRMKTRCATRQTLRRPCADPEPFLQSAFEMSSDAGGASSESESYSEDASASDYSGSGSEEESESGADWSDMERKAAKSDAKKKEGKAAKAPAKGKSNGRRKDDSDSDVSIDSVSY